MSPDDPRPYLADIAELDGKAEWRIVAGPDVIRVEIAENGGLLRPVGFDVSGGDEGDEDG